AHPFTDAPPHSPIRRFADSPLGNLLFSTSPLYPPPMPTDSLSHLTPLVLQFLSDRDWAQVHTTQEPASSLVVRSAELLQLLQCKQCLELDPAIAPPRTKIGDELADCLHSILLLAHDLHIDLSRAFCEKLHKAPLKYPIEKSKGKPRKYTELDADS